MEATLYRGKDYLDFEAVERWCHWLAQTYPQWVDVTSIGKSRKGRDILLVTLTASGRGDRAPGFWLDGGTHAAEWTGVMAVLYALSSWIERLEAGDREAVAWFGDRAVFAVPCISPDGMQAMHDGEPFLRSSLRPPRPGEVRVGFETCDINGDGEIESMRWRHPAGSFVSDADWPLLMRPRRLEDDPADAFFLCPEGQFSNWDGTRWVAAPLKYGLDLNRNFPGHWTPFSMSGMDGGAFCLSEPESRAIVDAFAARPFVGVAVSNHTYSGCVLTQPYREASPLSDLDLKMMEKLAEDAVRGTGYRVFRVRPDFVYDPKVDIAGVWGDTIATVFGVPGYTLEMWDPYADAGVQIEKPSEFIQNPNEETIRCLLAHISHNEAAVRPWKAFAHPQLGAVEIGGLDYMKTIRNPPPERLMGECEKGLTIFDRMRRALPYLSASARCEPLGNEMYKIVLTLENTGFLPTSALPYGEKNGSPGASAQLACGEGVQLLSAGTEKQILEHLNGWGNNLCGGARNPIYAKLPVRSHARAVSWLVRGCGEAIVRWSAGRAGEGTLKVAVPEP